MGALTWVLLVEDDPDHRLLIRQAVRRAAPGVRVDEASDTEAAVRVLSARRKAGEPLDDGVVILDLGLPGPSGFTVLEWLRDRGLDGLPAFVLTSSGNEMDAEHAFHLGARGYFQKPAAFGGYPEILERVFELATAAVTDDGVDP
jgi:DNA-binding response OmpR family regulator